MSIIVDLKNWMMQHELWRTVLKIWIFRRSTCASFFLESAARHASVPESCENTRHCLWPFASSPIFLTMTPFWSSWSSLSVFLVVPTFKHVFRILYLFVLPRLMSHIYSSQSFFQFSSTKKHSLTNSHFVIILASLREIWFFIQPQPPFSSSSLSTTTATTIATAPSTTTKLHTLLSTTFSSTLKFYSTTGLDVNNTEEKQALQVTAATVSA